MKRILLLLFGLGLLTQLSAQYPQVDSLMALMEVAPDSMQLHYNVEIAKAYKKSPRRDTFGRRMGMVYAQEARLMARSLGDTTVLIETLNLLEWYYTRNKGMEDSLKSIKIARNYLKADDVYLLPENYKSWRKNESVSLARRTAWHFYDSTGTLSLEQIKPTDFAPYLEPDNQLITYPGAWWMRVKLQSKNENWEEHVFYTGGKVDRWDTVKAFWQLPGDTAGFRQVITGELIDSEKWDIPESSNHFRVSVPPQSSFYLYVRVRGLSSGVSPDRLVLNHVNYESYLRQQVKDRHTNGIFQGIVLIQLFFFFLLFIATRDRTYGDYVLYILGLCLYILTVNYATEIPFIISNQQGVFYVIALWLSVIGMLTFSYNYLNMDEYLPKWRRFMRVYYIIFTVLAIILAMGIPFFVGNSGITENFGWLIPAIFAAMFLGIMVFAALVFLPIWGIKVYRKGYSPAKYYLLATGFLILGFLFPIIISPLSDYLQVLGLGWMNNASTMLEAGIAIQLCLFALAVGHKWNLLEKEKREALENSLQIQQRINAATDRFVPYEFLKTLGRESILDVNLGDQAEKNVTVFFSDIRDYTSLSEQMTPQQNFIFLNAYLGRMGPIIKTNRGFVNQYYGDGIMALFMDENSGIHSPNDAIKAAVGMHRELRKYNDDRIAKQRNPIKIGIGLHTGNLMLGVIGDEKRMDVGVVSDTVNTAARMEGLTKYYGSSIIVSESTFDGLTETDGFNYRFLGRMLVKGKKEPLRIYDFFDGDSAERFDKKAGSVARFDEALQLYYDQRFDEAIKIFNEILRGFPEDKASQYYLNRAEENKQLDLGKDWDGFETMYKK